MATACEMIEVLEAALKENPGVVQVTIDGTTVRIDRKQALDELDYWRRRAAVEAGKRSRLSSINLGRCW